MNLAGRSVRLRAVEPRDIDLLYAWENDPAVWPVSGTTEPFSRLQIEQFIETQQHDIFETRQQRLMIETLGTGLTSGADEKSETVGTLDLFEVDPVERRAGIGILIYAHKDRDKGYASDAVKIVCEYARENLRLHQLWSTVGADNEASLALFRRAGFEQTGVRRDWHWTGAGYADEIMFQKIL